MCLTLANAATIHHHTDPTGTAVRGYTATSHHAGHLTPGDQWRPVPDQPPRTVTDIHRRHGVIALTDQYGSHLDLPRHQRHPHRRPRPPAPPHLDHRDGRRHPMTRQCWALNSTSPGHRSPRPTTADENSDDRPDPLRSVPVRPAHR